jgi:predicted O-linked N-acetylglucosamine transferase (SPINDLY family)
VGYLSPDLRQHSVAYFLEGVLENHDRRLFEIHAFDASPYAADRVSDRLRAHVEFWHGVGNRSDEEVAGYVRETQIDILVDLAGHTANNRLLVFARRPAPVQVAWFGYVNTTGLTTIDYRLIDAWLAPVGCSDEFYTEKLFRIPNATIFRPGSDIPVGTLPAERNGFVTFASLNQWAKVTEAAKNVWAEILRATPHSRLVVIARGGDNEQIRNLILADFQRRAISSDRVDVVGFLPLDPFLKLLNTIDIAFDSFPYGGLTTTFHAAWMGVPTIALESHAEIGRSSPEVLRILGLSEFIAEDVAGYVRVGQSMAKDLDKLADCRAELRERLTTSPFADARAVVCHVESAYRTMWEQYCLTAG